VSETKNAFRWLSTAAILYGFGPYDRRVVITATEPSGIVQQQIELPPRACYQFFGDPNLKVSIKRVGKTPAPKEPEP
jgi:hypothetical protein